MLLYIIRHGESEYNAKKWHQPGWVELSEDGKKQAEFVGERFKTIQIDTLFASDYTRAYHTAEQISKQTGKQIEVLELLRERKKPSEQENHHVDDPSAKEIKTLCDAHIEDPGWHYSDEENFHDFKKRILDLIDFLTKLNQESVCIVTHSGVIKLLITLLIFGEETTPESYKKMGNVLKTHNTGMTVCRKDDKNQWQLITWNDIAHLGE